MNLSSTSLWKLLLNHSFKDCKVHEQLICLIMQEDFLMNFKAISYRERFDMVEEDQQTQVSHVFFPEWMNEWLCQWHERGFQQSKDFLSSDEEQWKSLVQLR
ncbi:hypothetical protein YC2023_029443 [Brassica napus]